MTSNVSRGGFIALTEEVSKITRAGVVSKIDNGGFKLKMLSTNLKTFSGTHMHVYIGRPNGKWRYL